MTAVPETGVGDTPPNTGLFDDVFGGNPVGILLIGLSLVGIIVISRRLRSGTK